MSTTIQAGYAGQRQAPQAAWRRLCAAAVISIEALLGLAATAEAGIIVSLQQVDSSGSPISSVEANPNPAQQTLAYADLVVSGSGSPLPVADLYSFATVMSWSTSSSGIGVTDLYTVNSSGTPFIGTTAMSVNGTGFLFNGGLDAPATSAMNVINLNSDFQRYTLIDNFEFSPTLADPVGSTTIARIRFAVSPGVTNATFSLSLNGSGGETGYGFLTNGNVTYPFTNGGGTIAVVPEPRAIPVCLVGLVMVGGWMSRRSRRHRGSSAPMASAA